MYLSIKRTSESKYAYDAYLHLRITGQRTGHSVAKDIAYYNNSN